MLKSFFHAVSMTTTAGRQQFETQVEEQRKFASQQCPRLAEKRQQAIAYLGEKWLLHPNHSPKNMSVPQSKILGVR